MTNPRPVNGITFTTEYSYISVLYTGNDLLLDFPFDHQVKDSIKRIPGCKWNTYGNKKWTVPKNASNQLKKLFPPHLLSFKSNEEIKRDAAFFSFEEETLEDVLARIPKSIDASFMKLPPKNFQKVTMGWVATPKGKRGHVYGGILGDTMGLGKTIQALASAAYLKQQGIIKRCLIVTEAGIKDQWAGEIERFTNESYLLIDGSGKKNVSPSTHRRNLLQKVQDENIFFTVTNYELLKQREIIGTEEVVENGKVKNKQIQGDYTDLGAILDNEYDMIILDEAQKIRNLKTLVCQSVYQIQSPQYRLIMTGTPIEKEIHNIFPLVDYLSPNIFADASMDVQERLRLFEDKFLVKSLNQHALPKRVPEATGTKNLSLLNKILMPYMLSRSLDDVGDEMPKSSVQMERCEWEENQLRFYLSVLDTLEVRNEEWAEAYRTENGVYAEMENAKKQGRPYHGLLDQHQNLQHKRLLLENEVKALRLYCVEICDTPELLLWSESSIAHRLLGADSFYGKIHRKAQNIRKKSDLSDAEIEAKLHALFEKEVPMVPKLRRYLDCVNELCLQNNEKIITFTKFERMAKILEREVRKMLDPDQFSKKKKKSPKLGEHFLYTGSTTKGCAWKSTLKKQGTPMEEPPCSTCPLLSKCQTRRKAQWHLQNDPFTKVLIATDAANAGVNLQSARYNFNYDLPDSPAKYNQRNGRIQRIGSPHKNVIFINMVTTNGIDERKFKRIMEKQADINTATQLSVKSKASMLQAADEMDDDDNDDIDLVEEQSLIQELRSIKK